MADVASVLPGGQRQQSRHANAFVVAGQIQLKLLELRLNVWEGSCKPKSSSEGQHVREIVQLGPVHLRILGILACSTVVSQSKLVHTKRQSALLQSKVPRLG